MILQTLRACFIDHENDEIEVYYATSSRHKAPRQFRRKIANRRDYIGKQTPLKQREVIEYYGLTLHCPNKPHCDKAGQSEGHDTQYH